VSGAGRPRLAFAAGLGVVALAAVAGGRDLAGVARTWSDMGPLAPGREIPRFRAELLDGGVLDNDALSGQVTLLAFWATWCGVCERQMPGLQALQRRHRGRGLRVIGVDTDRGRDQAKLVERYRAEHGLELEMALDKGPVGGAFRVSLLPHVALVDKRGRLRHVHQGLVSEHTLDEEVTALLTE
jgi:peroxiredoxin